MKLLIYSTVGAAVLCGAIVAGQNSVSMDVSLTPVDESTRLVSLKITNGLPLPISALRLQWVCVKVTDTRPPATLGRTDDPSIRMHAQSDLVVAAGGSADYQVGIVHGPAGETSCSGAVKAALFSDGSSVGDAARIARMRRDRLLVAAEVEWHLAALGEAVKSDDGRESILERIAEHRKSISGTPDALDLDSYIRQTVSDVLTSNLGEMHFADGRMLPDRDRMKVMLSEFQNWHLRLTSAAEKAIQ
jgi:hypothetical protein